MEKASRYAKENGVYYTPADLAEFLVTPLITSSETSILDPAYGEGSLLLAAERVVKRIEKKSSVELFGCDTKPVNGLLKHIPLAHLQKMDFFSFPIAKKFDLIFTNPPYIRHHLLSQEWIDKNRELFPELRILSSLADLWAYFMVKSVLHLKPNGSMAAILPWAFIQADYALPLRVWLAERFGEIRLLSLSDKFFERADERVILVWLKKYGEPFGSIKIGSAKTFSEEIEYTDIPKESWLSQKILHTDGVEIKQILDSCKATYGFTEFGASADVKIGVVTGADKYFIVTADAAKDLKIHHKNLQPIISTVKSFPKVLVSGTTELKRLIVLKKKHYKKYRSYIQKGISRKLHKRAHSELREPWYSVKVGRIPDAFFPYRSSKAPYLLRNTYRIQSTNSVHRIYFKDLTEFEIRWIQVSLLSSIGLLSLESNSKTYGRGMLKIEPNSLKKVLVLKRNDDSINDVYFQILELLKTNNKGEAIALATNFICRSAQLPPEVVAAVERTLRDFQDVRL